MRADESTIPTLSLDGNEAITDQIECIHFCKSLPPLNDSISLFCGLFCTCGMQKLEAVSKH